MTEYAHCRLAGSNDRGSLTKEEEWRIFKKIMPERMGLFRPFYGPIQVGCYSQIVIASVNNYKPFYGDIVKDIESELMLFVKVKEVSPLISTPEFPLDGKNIKDTKIGNKMLDDLAESCGHYYKLPKKSLEKKKRLPLPLQERCDDILLNIITKRSEVEEYLIRTINTIPDDIGPDAVIFKFKKLSNLAPTITTIDLMSMLLSTPLLLTYNPYFTEEACGCIISDVILWLQLCVLEDKLKRILKLCENANGDEQLIQELEVKRNWSVKEHTEWLVFEVEGCLQIRPKQYDVAKSLIDNPGAIVQLNMGEGKTRVILPLLILYWGSNKEDNDCIIRLTFLTQLLGEAFSYLHQYLSASILGRKLFLLPFSRDVDLTVERVRAIEV